MDLPRGAGFQRGGGAGGKGRAGGPVGVPNQGRGQGRGNNNRGRGNRRQDLGIGLAGEAGGDGGNWRREHEFPLLQQAGNQPQNGNGNNGNFRRGRGGGQDRRRAYDNRRGGQHNNTGNGRANIGRNDDVPLAVESDEDAERNVDVPRKVFKKPERKFEGPVFGFKRLYNFLNSSPDDVLLSINKDKEAWNTLLTSGDLEGEKLILAIHVLAEKVCADVPVLLQQQTNALTACCNREFVDKLGYAVSKISIGTFLNPRRRNTTEMEVDSTPKKVLGNVHTICSFIMKTMPHAIVDHFGTLLNTSMGASYNTPDILAQFKDLHNEMLMFIENRQKKFEKAEERRNRYKFNDEDIAEFDADTPPDSIKDINIIPSVEELRRNYREETFLRPNKTTGKYNSAEHYLDVQFRLLREDFVRPLRKGISTFMKNRQEYMAGTKKMPLGEVRLYTEVRIIQVAKERDSIVYKLQLPEKSYKRIRWEKSKRLLTGSLLVLTSTEKLFATAYFAIVFSRNVKELEKGIVTVVWEGAPPSHGVNEEEEYILFESEVYLEAYRHTLTTLKNLELENFKMKKFIVDSSSVVEAPSYLKDATKLLRLKLLSGEERYIAPLVFEQWPQAHEFGLDDNQFQAYRAAISSEFSIIQGPPGTGKTFLGLKVTEVLLDNADLWEGTSGNPITVVCYTNHALDQFLEGILNYYKKEEVPAEIIRIGGRCQSEILSKYTLQEVRKRSGRKLPSHYWNSLRNAKEEVYELEGKRADGMTEVGALQDLDGIINFEQLSIWSKIQIEFPKDLWTSFNDLQWFGISDNQLKIENFSEARLTRSWLQVRKFPKKIVKTKPSNQEAVKANTGKTSPVDEEWDEEDFDLDELMENRIFDDIMLEAETSQRSNMGRRLTYLPDCSVNLCERSINHINKEIQKAMQSQNLANTPDIRQIRKDNILVLDNRKKLLGEIFRLYKEHLIDLPDVSDLIKEIQGRVGAVHYKRLNMSERWALYFAVVDRARTLAAKAVTDIEIELSDAQKALRDVIQHGDSLILKGCKVVGLTTTGAAKYNNLLKAIASKIVIVEEAAEVFEAHIVTCVTSNCEQLILIGDHRQLRPSPTVYELATKYHLDLSLFERMINNNLHCYQLKIQHRMRPDIADLVVGSIYEELLNHESVKCYPDVEGVRKNLFFVTHTEQETAETDSCSKSNAHEAKFVAAFCRYLKLQGYRSDQITVLTMYTGQMFLLKKEISNTKTCQGVRVTCVDNFQGEENDIILLSLVRSNSAGKIGFLGVDNRICVSLSRARHGLYVIGNMSSIIDNSKTWRKITEKLEAHDNIGESLELICQIHETRTQVQCDKDFNQVSEGGCSVLCDTTLPCSHKCPRVCHVIDRKHELHQCRFPCLKSCENQVHKCRGKCFEICPPCIIRVDKVLNCELQHKRLLPCHVKVDGIECTEPVRKTLPCRHEEVMACHINAASYICRVKVLKTLPCEHIKELECFVDPGSVRCREFVDKSLQPFCEHTQKEECWKLPEDIKCTTLISRKIDKCGHEEKLKCCDRGKVVPCRSKCNVRLDCGHSCVKICHIENDPQHLLYKCDKECSRECADGSHKCNVRHKCHKQPCPPCKEKIKRILPCGHEKELECWIDVNTYECLELCERILPEPVCRHKCTNLCYQPCGPCTVKVKKRAPCGHWQEVLCSEGAFKEKCNELVSPKRTPLCGHQDGKVPCKHDMDTPEELLKHCQKPCDHQFNPAGGGGCGHSCHGTCSTCLQGRIHMKCQEKCGKQLVCGHVCEVPCSNVCPPCLKPCFMKCEHSECTKKCGEPCSDCKEKCTWSCKHLTCTNLCGEMCNREACNEPCPKKLPCGHECVGFCGEPCPPYCRICNTEELTSFFLLGNEEDEDARFVYLEDCRHAIEVEGLKGWLSTSGEGQISAKRCPRCKTAIRNCRRFGNLIRQHYKDVVQVKMKSFGNKANADRLRNKWITELGSDSTMQRILPVVHDQIRGFLLNEAHTQSGAVRLIPKSIDEFAMRSIDFTASCAQKISDDITILRYEGKLANLQLQRVVNQFRKTLSCMLKRQPLSRQEILDFNEELDRVDYLKQLMIRRSLPGCNEQNAPAYSVYRKAKQIVTSSLPFTQQRKEDFKALLKELDDRLKSGLGISDRERQSIVSAMGMTQGHWYKCPNGHIYVITECGGATQEGICNECGARIGGGSHRLRTDNQLASEMDGAQRPAWPPTLVNY